MYNEVGSTVFLVCSTVFLVSCSNKTKLFAGVIKKLWLKPGNMYGTDSVKSYLFNSY